MTESICIKEKPEKNFPDFLRDESRRIGSADSIAFPQSGAEVKEFLKTTGTSCSHLTIQGARTGIVAGAVPEGGCILNLSRMNRILEFREAGSGKEAFVTMEPGVMLQDLRDAVAEYKFSRNFFFTPDPTETTASIGGMVATDASGALSYKYKATRDSITAMSVALENGDVLYLKRGTCFAEGFNFKLKTESGSVIKGKLPSYKTPHIKNAAGYYVAPDMDMIDLFIGSEGTLGVIFQIETRLLPVPDAVWGLMAFLPSQNAAIEFIEEVKSLHSHVAAIEFFDNHSLDFLRNMKREGGFDQIPDLPQEWQTAVYIEFHGGSEEEVEQSVMQVTEIMIANGGSEEATWLASEPKEMQKLKDFRHAVPEAVNSMIDKLRKNEPALTKLGTDLAVPDEQFSNICSTYVSDLEQSGLEYVIFGHAGDNHLHVNIIPKSLSEYDKGKDIYHQWAGKVTSIGGTVSAEHGIGKLKRDMLEIMYSREGIGQMLELKKIFDPELRLNRANMFLPDEVGR